MKSGDHRTPISRRDLLKAGGGALAAAAAGPHLRLGRAQAQSPKRGGTLSLRLWDPPFWDPHLTISYKTHIALTFTHSRLLKHKAGPGVQPGTFPIEGDLAESWSQPTETSYIFKLRKGVRWHNKPPVNGRELTAEDVKYTFDRFVGEKGNANRYMMAALEKVEVLDRHTVKMSLKEPFAWFLDMVSNPMALAIIPREAVEKFGDLKKSEAVIGTGPWMLDSYRPNVGYTYVRNPNYFVAGLPHIDRVEVTVDEDNASRIAAFIAGKYDLGWENPGAINRVDWVQIKDTLRQKRPKLQVAEFPANVMSQIYMRTDKPPFSDARVRRAISLAFNRREIVDAVGEGVGVFNPAVPAALKEWSVPMEQLGEGARYYKYDLKEARRLMAEAGYPNGFQATLDFTSYGSTILVDAMQLLLKYLKDLGIDAKLNQKEYGAYITTTFYGKYDSMAFGPQTPFLDPDNFLYGLHVPGELKNQSHVNDPVLTDMLIRQRRTFDIAKRRELIYDVQRYLAKQQYYVYQPSQVYVGVWDGALKNYGPNIGYDYGGRLQAAWLDR
ncbi:MAG TPA: ABC transporter substrate-binding protein [Methylomirabilota bacterium]|nr:ABC transporter substrate-binding protein [Methylomirabilota bacterium]